MKEKTRKNSFRLWFQAAFFALTNGYANGFLHGKIFKGKSKLVCVPGLNCYSCPGALFSCPIGSLQSVLTTSNFKVSCYAFGFLMAFGAFFGRLVCGWMCPFGLVQDCLYKIPLFKKIKNLPGHKYFNWLRFIILALFVLILPSLIRNTFDIGKPWFCEYICPSGTLIAGLPLISANADLRALIGAQFFWKLFLLIAIILASIKVYRPFCKYLCPLGALYGLCNPISLYRLDIDKDKCTNCGACTNACKMGIDVLHNPNSTECIRCMECKHACGAGAITASFAGKTRVKPKRLISGIVLIAAFALIGIGISTGEFNIILTKATNICLQCIGLN